MKSLFYFLLLSASLLVACSPSTSSEDTTQPAQPIIIEGTISNISQPFIVLLNEAENWRTPVNNGQFRFEISASSAEVLRLQYGRGKYYLFAKPGDHLTLQLDGTLFPQSVVHSGDSQEENKYLAQKTALDKQDQSRKMKDYQLEETAYIKVVEERKNRKYAELESYMQNVSFDQSFVDLIKTDIEYEWATDRVIYPYYHSFYTKNDNFQVSDRYDDYLKELNLDNGRQLNSSLYKAFLNNYLDLKTRKENPGQDYLVKDNAQALDKFNLIQSQFKSQAVKDFLYYRTLKTHIKLEGANGTQALLQNFQENCKNPAYLADVQKDYSNWKQLEAGLQAPGFAYADIQGQVHDIADYRGKYVYIDVWATWCGPCRREIPHLEELQQQYKDNEKIVFASVSIDQNTSAWQTMVTDDNMQGLQLLADQAWKSSIVKDYKIAGIPRFLLIDPAGKIVSANAPRPSSKRLKAKLATLVGS